MKSIHTECSSSNIQGRRGKKMQRRQTTGQGRTGGKWTMTKLAKLSDKRAIFAGSSSFIEARETTVDKLLPCCMSQEVL